MFAMLGRWGYALVSELRSYRSAPSERRSPWSVIAVGLLHSGPWGVAIAACIGYYVVSAPHAAWWVWVFTGAITAPAVLITAALIGHLFKTAGTDPSLPLTPDRLNQARRRTLWFGTLFYGIGMSIVMLYFAWEKTPRCNYFPSRSLSSQYAWVVGTSLQSSCGNGPNPAWKLVSTSGRDA